jgi:hypothetical protein
MATDKEIMTELNKIFIMDISNIIASYCYKDYRLSYNRFIYYLNIIFENIDDARNWLGYCNDRLRVADINQYAYMD